MIDGHTQLVGLIGWPVGHSLSPAMHNAVFEALGLNWRYVPLSVEPGQVEQAVRGLVALGFRGANVTVPHKRAVMPALDTIGPDADALGAVNTLVVRRHGDRGTGGQRDKGTRRQGDQETREQGAEDGAATVAGYNTDARGFVDALRGGGFEPGDGERCVVVGAGGAARAVVFGLLRAGTGEVVVLNRTPERAQALVSDLGSSCKGGGRLRALPLTPEALIETARAADLLVNATTVGMGRHADNSIWPAGVPVPAHLTVFDVVYSPLETMLLRQARRSGARAIDGLGMLVRQGALALDRWTDRALDEADIDRASVDIDPDRLPDRRRSTSAASDEVAALMRAACRRALEARSAT